MFVHMRPFGFSPAPFVGYRADMKRCQRIEDLLDDARQDLRCAVGLVDADRRALRRRLDAGELISPYRNLYARPDDWTALDVEQRTMHVARAIALLHPGWTFAGLTAATIHGFDHAIGLHDGTVTIASRRSNRSGDAKQLRRICMVDERMTIVQGLRVTDGVRTLLDCGSTYSFQDALAIFDSAARQGVSIGDVWQKRHAIGVDAASIATLCTYADGRSENGGESAARAVMIVNGFLRPQLQRRFENPDNPRGPYRVDFSWELADKGIVVAEFDGTGKYVARGDELGRNAIRSAVHAERRREERLRAQGVTSIVRLEFEDVVHPDRLIAKLCAAGVPRA